MEWDLIFAIELLCLNIQQGAPGRELIMMLFKITRQLKNYKRKQSTVLSAGSSLLWLSTERWDYYL